ncbi:MAG: nucleotidyltransferase domain-containing protein [Candidatus Omnitrophica bacterium]|nr:nucleotidyltransferase domain-containing protein [Candidatus Omnitrophota bacterium]
MDITKIFKSKARRALFRLYFTNPEKSFYLRELERGLDTPVSILRKELMTLEKEGIFDSARKGNLLYYSLNKQYPLYDELKNIVFKTIGVQGALSQSLLPLKDIEAAFIYGSYAKNVDNAKSDIDLFIIGNPDEGKLIEKINTLEKKLKREINYNIYSKNDIKKKKKLKDSFMEDVLESKKIFLIGGKNDL